MKARRTLFRWIIGAAVLAVCVSIVWAVLAITGAVQSGVDHAVGALDQPGVPEPGQAEAAAVTLTTEGVPLTIKQRANAWLPGGQFRLHLDDITSRQVLISITDRSEQVVMGPLSVKAGETILLEHVQPAMLLEVRRLVNVLTGEDFGEFIIRAAAPRQ